MKTFTFLIVLCFIFKHAHTQGLHEIRCTANGSTAADTYLEDINDKGLIAGYYDAIQNKGFIINALGEFVETNASTLNPVLTQTRIVGINNQNTVSVQALSSSGNYEMVKGYYNPYVHDITLETIGNNQQPNLARNTKLNNLNDFCGWYQGTSSRWLYVSHDSIVPSLPAWKADRYSVGPTFYNTICGGLNDNLKLVGYYIDGSFNIPFVFDVNSSTFTLINTTMNMRVYDINNGNTIVGEYKQANNIWMAFKAELDVTNGNLSGFTSLASVFQSNTISSYAKGINNQGMIVGSYQHPSSGIFTGFVYFPSVVDSFQLHNFSYSDDIWSQIKNKGTGPDNMWPPSLYAGIDYFTDDPYVNNGVPLIDSFIQTMHSRYTRPTSVPPRSSPEWNIFANLIDTANVALSSDPYIQEKYKTIYKYKYFNKYVNSVFVPGWAGMCYGFSNTVLRKKYTNIPFTTVYNLNSAQPIGSIDNTNHEAIRSIQAEFTKQIDYEHQAYIGKYKLYGGEMYPYQAGLYYLKYHYATTFANANPRSLNPGSGHSVLPYKIKSPKTFPFDIPTIQQDTVFIYENGKPEDSSVMALFIGKFINQWSAVNDSVNWMGHYNQDYKAYFFTPAVKDAGMMKTKILAQSKRVRNFIPDTIFALNVTSANDYQLNAGSGSAHKAGGSLTITPGNLQPFYLLDSTRKFPAFYHIDSNAIVQVETGAYVDSAMQWNISSEHLNMGINRLALPGEIDRGQCRGRQMTYSNPDNILKTLSCFSILHDDAMEKAYNILAHNLSAAYQDSLLIQTNADFTLTIKKIQGASSNYDLWVFADNGDSIKQFKTTGIPIGNNESHIIDPFYSTSSGFQTVVYVDNGSNGSYEDTLFIPNVPLIITENTIQNTHFVHRPNPTRDILYADINLDKPQALQWKLTDIYGKVVQQGRVNMQFKTETISINLQACRAGIYHLQWLDTTNKVVQTETIEKQ